MSRRTSARLALVTVSTVASLVVVYLLWPDGAQEGPPVARGPQGEYDLSFVDRQGRPLSERTGLLKLVISPFTVYANLPNQSSVSYHIDERGFRGRYTYGKSLIAVVGGSAAFGQGLSGDDETFASRIQARHPEFEVLNAGVVGYLSGQELAQMVHTLDELHPRVYVAFDGWNDLFEQYLAPPRRRGGEFGFNSSFFMFEKGLRGERKRWRRHRRRTSAPDESREDKKRKIASDRRYLEQIFASYEANIGRMNAFATSRGAKLLVVFQPELGAKKTRTEAETDALEHWAAQTRYVSKEFPQRYAEMARHASAIFVRAGIPFLDLNDHPSFTEASETLFLDVVHLNARGHDLAAHLAAAEIAKLLAH